MWIALKTLLRNLVLPPTGPLLLALVGLVLARRRVRGAYLAMAAGVGSLWLLATPLIADALLGIAERSPPLDPAQPVSAEAIVVLGGGRYRLDAAEFGGGRAAGFELLERLDYAAWLARRLQLPILVTGDGDEARAMVEVLQREYGLECRWVEAAARDTFENARNAMRLLAADHVGRIVLVTSATHMWRATHEFEAAGARVTPAPVGTRTRRKLGWRALVPNAYALLDAHDALYELLGEPARIVLEALHLRRQQAGGGPGRGE